jgi:hypothetical protein
MVETLRSFFAHGSRQNVTQVYEISSLLVLWPDELTKGLLIRDVVRDLETVDISKWNPHVLGLTSWEPSSEMSVTLTASVRSCE